MIEKLLIEDEHNITYFQLNNEKQLKYQELMSKIDDEPEKYIVAVDLAKPDSKDFSIILKVQKDKDGNIIVKKIKNF